MEKEHKTETETEERMRRMQEHDDGLYKMPEE